jgi:hypothetical protein
MDYVRTIAAESRSSVEVLCGIVGQEQAIFLPSLRFTW